MSGQAESSNPELVGVERPAIEWLKTLGYQHIKGRYVEQTHKAEPVILESVLIDRLHALNPWLAEVPNGASKAIKQLRDIWFEHNSDLMLANHAFWKHVLFQSNLQQKDKNGQPRSIQFINKMGAEDNLFHVVDQYVGKNANDELFKPDLLLFINGLPLGLIECKNSSIKLSKGIAQIDGYQGTFTQHFAFNMVCAAINRSQAKYGAIYAPEQFYLTYKFDPKKPDENIVLTELENQLGKPPTEQDKLLWALFEPSRFVRLVCFYPMYEIEKGVMIKKLPRYQQWRAVEKTLLRLQGKDPQLLGQELGGVVWHTQGSGKSLTMALLARLMRAEISGFNNPSILILTDRTDLDRQIHNTFTNVGLESIKADSVAGLEAMLSNDYGTIFTSTVQKFQESDGKQIQAAKESEDEDSIVDSKSRVRRVLRKDDSGQEQCWILKENNVLHGQTDASGNPKKAKWELVSEEKVDFRVLSTKPNFFVMVDEAHRSQYGFLAAFMRASLPNAKFIAFTGTPLFKDDKETLGTFGGKEYIDTYRLDEAVADGATLPIKYLEGMAQWGSDGKLKQAFEDEFGNEPLARKKKLKQELLKKRRGAIGRIEENARHLVEHFLSSVKPRGFKAMLVCDGRDMAVRYKDVLNQIMQERQNKGLPTFESRVVISLGSMTDKRTGISEQQAHYASGATSKLETIEERIKRELKQGQTPIAVPSEKIPSLVNDEFKLPYGDESANTKEEIKFNNIGLIIVSDMLLTGWDAPIVSTLYLDKPLKEHTLLQAIARVNRTRKGKKAGYIVDYFGVVEYLDEALKVYGGDVQPDQVWTDVEAELPRLQSALTKVLDILPKKHNPVKQPEPYKEDADLYLDPDTRLDIVEDFLVALAGFNSRLDIVLPDERASKYQPYFKVLNEIKLQLRNKMPESADMVRITASESELLKNMLDEHIEASEVKSLLGREVSILEAADMDLLRKQKSAGSAALVMKNKLKHTIKTGKGKDPAFFGDLEEELEKLIQDEREGRIEQALFLEQLELFAQRVRDKDAKPSEMGLGTATERAVFNYLEKQVEEAEALAWTKGIFSHPDIAEVMLSPIWKKQTDIHNEIKKTIRTILRGLGGWDMTVARQHSAEIFSIMLNN
ncbi:deoxyribonuclease HsdR [Vibrio parahaemolyticus]|uniref:type I restriction endonuclease subunit R n=2 Tax=Vibrio parahaemolyticus TaxID=670 RepID=UPI001120018D|nr:type I restriction endonuclease [Vibrio parahaemolyticus]EGR2016755.1 type I restriction endonuclease subunit R [Vibrio cholerae]HDY7775878.1 type I restriction endonuclease subunit R [Vibrio vulnificus]EGR2444971.1 type I restriction endonuclease subunit R [Vibrio cholerae]TOL18741.1 deoxyribonuclease HsdR [Vibrio parahaemolyticus]TOL60516.1 deoxyribonuclease HsdR [Vibrio parahaemolyticus]